MSAFPFICSFNVQLAAAMSCDIKDSSPEKTLPSFTPPQVVSNVFELLSSVENKIDHLKNVGNKTVAGSHLPP